MFIRVSGKDFKTVMQQLMLGSSESVNFYKTGNILQVHSYGTVLQYQTLNILESDVDSFEVTVVMDRTVELLEDKESVSLVLDHELFKIVQNRFLYTTEISYESRIEVNAYGVKYDSTIRLSELKGLVDDCKVLDSLARALGVRYSAINIQAQKAYLVYSNTALVVPTRLPDMAIAGETLKKLIKVLVTRENISYYLNLETRLLYFECPNLGVAVIQTGEVDMHATETINKALMQLKVIQSVDVGSYSKKLATICDVYKRALIELVVGESGLGFYVSNAGVRFEVGNTSQAKCSIKLATEQAFAIQKLFSEDNNVIISRGENKICLAQKNCGKDLLIAGLLY